jgi:hypothetical protein
MVERQRERQIEGLMRKRPIIFFKKSIFPAISVASFSRKTRCSHTRVRVSRAQEREETDSGELS